MMTIYNLIVKHLGEKWSSYVTFFAAGILTIVYLPQYVVTQEAYAQEKREMDYKVVAYRLDNVELKLTLAKRDKNALLDYLDTHPAKPRHQELLKEYNDQIRVLDSVRTHLKKILEEGPQSLKKKSID